MLVIMLLALGSAFLASAGAQFEHLDQQMFVGSGPTLAETVRRLASVGAVGAHADALAHIHFFRRAGIRARQAHLSAIHGVMNR